jgi:hypothetical protein
MSDVADLAAIEVAINRTYPCLQLFARDVDLSAEQAKKYTTGLVIRERGFTDATPRLGGMVTTHRFAIMSNHMADLDAILCRQERAPDPEKPNWQLHVAQRDSHFKVLGQQQFEDKTLIFLLHLPDDDTWRLLAGVSTNIDRDLLADSIARMERRLQQPPIPEVTSQQWLERCQFLLGMSDEGVLFPLED